MDGPEESKIRGGYILTRPYLSEAEVWGTCVSDTRFLLYAGGRDLNQEELRRFHPKRGETKEMSARFLLGQSKITRKLCIFRAFIVATIIGAHNKPQQMLLLSRLWVAKTFIKSARGLVPSALSCDVCLVLIAIEETICSGD